MRYRKFLSVALLAMLLAGCGLLNNQRPTRSGAGRIPNIILKREFRGAWLPTIFRSEYTGLSRAEGRELIGNRIALLHKLGCNVILFQVRAEGDAWYRSNYEPWSRFFTGKQGQAPREDWDPLAFAIEECHRLGMELHAWINPYRGATNAKADLAPNHIARQHPEWFVTYNKQLVLNPGLPEGRRYLSKVVEDIVMRYDIDALHMDDYFYPYPVAGEEFPDEDAFERYGLSAGYRPEDKALWRRSNVNLLVYDIRQTLLRTKPWVRLGVSPFGIYRNNTADPKGSATSGLQCYDDLFADVLHWANEGWVDYVAPQVYWNIGHPVADYETLVEWWSKAIRNKKVQLYIGQDVKRTMDAGQLDRKMMLSRGYADGNIFWPGDELVRNYKNSSEQLRADYQTFRALLPVYSSPLGKTKAPKPLDLVWEDLNEEGHMLLWDDMRDPKDPEGAFMYVIYAYPQGVKPATNRAEHIVSISTNPEYKLPQLDNRTEYTYWITVVNRFWQESKPYKLKVKL